jgi:hypothetical protein
MIYATLTDVDDAYEGTIPTGDNARVTMLCKRASARLYRLMPSIDYRIATGELDPDLPRGLVVDAVLRVYRNPEGVTAEEIGPFHKAFNPRSVHAEITFDESEVQQLLAPIPNYVRPSIKVGMPSPKQVMSELAGLAPYDPDKDGDDDSGFSTGGDTDADPSTGTIVF